MSDATWEGIARAAEANVDALNRAEVQTLAEAAAAGMEPPPMFTALVENQRLMWRNFAKEIRRIGRG